MKRLLILITGLTLALAACSGEVGENGVPRIKLEATELALGEMPNGQIAERELAVRNDGDGPLVVNEVITSCGCTTATLEPMTIAPGESGKLRVVFDSGAHGPDLRGPLMREVTLLSNDPVLPEARITVTATILSPVE